MTPTTPEPQRKKRKLRYPRTTQACDFCRRRKVRCSGSYPCENCVREENTCEYAGGLPDTASASKAGAHPTPTDAASIDNTPVDSSLHKNGGSSVPASASEDPAIVVSRRSSIEPPQTFTHGTHVGPTSGVSFLYGQWDKGAEPKSANQGESIEELKISHAPLISWGDLPQFDLNSLSLPSEPTFTSEQILDILDRYFQYISPTYRFLHHPTVKQWAIAMISRSKLPAACEASVLLVCAQTLLHSPVTPGQQVIGRGDHNLSMVCFAAARGLLDKEPGPPSLASVQARVAMCLYLLSTFRLNECRYCFSFAVTVATTLGIHRKQSSTRVNTLEAESRKRCFWSLYVLDGYLSVMLGRPRLLRDDDIDQPFPNNISDNDLMSLEPIDLLPRHGDLEAFIAHSKLAKLMARGNDQLYPLHPLSNDQLLQRSNEMLDILQEWQKDLPAFLQARQKTFNGQLTFARQNTILKLGWAHVRILTTRRCLLMDFTNPSQSQDPRAKRCIQECVRAIVMVLDTVEVLIEHGQCYGSFWSTQYIALVAISTLYVLVIQGVRIDNFLCIEDCVEKARRCHDHLATLPPAGSQAERHHVLLSHLRSKAERSLSRRKLPKSDPRSMQRSSDIGRPSDKVSDEDQNNGNSVQNNHNAGKEIFDLPQPTYTASTPNLDPSMSFVNQNAPNDMSMFGSILTPNSSADSNFQYMLDFGWESLDTIGASLRGPEGIYGFQGI